MISIPSNKEKEMKNVLVRSAVLAIASVGLMVGNALALGFPFADFQGAIFVDVDGNTPTYDGVHITDYVDLNGQYVFDSQQDSFIGQTVGGSMLSGVSYDYLTGTVTVDPNASANFYIGSADGSDPYLTATISNFSVTELGNNAYSISALLSNQQYFHTADSEFMAQYESASPDSGFQGELLSWDVVFTMPQGADYDYGVNVSGKMAPVPEPATMLLFGTGLAGLAGVVRRKKK